jgi:hypothetical protein
MDENKIPTHTAERTYRHTPGSVQGLSLSRWKNPIAHQSQTDRAIDTLTQWGKAKLTSVQKVGSAYRQDADCCKRYNISAKHFSFHGAVHEDVYSEEEFSAVDFIHAPSPKL